jgi:hypothetical protein
VVASQGIRDTRQDVLNPLRLWADLGQVPSLVEVDAIFAIENEPARLLAAVGRQRPLSFHGRRITGIVDDKGLTE